MVRSAPRDDAPARSGTQAVERAVAVLESFSDGDSTLGISEIAHRARLHVSTTHRLVRALVTAGYMEQDPASERYRLGIGIAVLGQRAFEQSGYHLARPVLDELSERTGESASLGIRRNDEVVVIERAVSHSPLRFDHPTGAEIALHASAMGKVLLAFSTGSIDDQIAELGHLGRFTERTITSRHGLRSELTRVREAGFATNVEERYAGVCGVAAPVRSADGRAHAAVGLQGPSIRMTTDRLAELAPLVVTAAAAVAALVIRI